MFGYVCYYVYVLSMACHLVTRFVRRHKKGCTRATSVTNYDDDTQNTKIKRSEFNSGYCLGIRFIFDFFDWTKLMLNS